MPDEKIKITKGAPSHTLGERLKFEVINPVPENEGYYLWNVFTYNDEEKEWKPIRTTNGKSYKFECHFEKESSDGVTFQVRVYKNDKKPKIEENTLLDSIEVTPHKRIEKAPKIVSTHFFPEGEYDTNNKVSVYDSLHLRAKTEGLTGKEIQFHVCQKENGKEVVKDTVSARVDHTDYATTKIKLPIDTIKSILTNKNQENQKDYYIKASFGLDKNGKKSTGEITKTYFIDKQGNPIEKISIGDTIRVCIDSKGEIADFLQYTIYEKDKHTSDDVIFQSPKFKLNNNHFFCREIVVTKELFNKGYGVSHATFDSDYNVQDYYIKVERFSGSANSKTFAVTSDTLKVHYGKSPVKVTVNEKKVEQLPLLKDIFLPALKIETANKISSGKETLHINSEKETYQILSSKSIMDIKQDGRARYIDIPITRIDRNSMYIHFSLFHLGERKYGYIYPIISTMPNTEKDYKDHQQIEKSLTGKVSVNDKERTTHFGDLVYRIYSFTTFIDFEITIKEDIGKDIYIDFYCTIFSSIRNPTTDGLIFKIKLPTKRSGFDIDAAIIRIHKEIDKRIDKNPTGSCATYVRYGLESGGMSTNGRPNYACNYGPFLLRKGFNQINITDPNDYTPIKGDIVVFDTYPGQPKYPAGHIQMYNGEKWVSDFVQRRFWPGTAYENDYKKRKEEKREVNFKIFRW